MTVLRNVIRLSTAALAATAFSAGVAQADAISDFYKGKRIQVFVGSGPGGGYDTYARMMGRHMGRHIPGKPEFLVKNMDGAGSIIAANYVYNVAAQDGTVIASLQRNAPIVQIMGQKGPRFEAVKFNWLGSFNNEVGIIAVAKRTGITKFTDLYNKEVVFGSTGPNDTEFYPALITNTLAAKVKLIKGYPSTPPTHLAMERGEVDAISQSWASFQQQSSMYPKGEMVLLAQVSLKPLPELKAKGVPLLTEFVTKDRLQPGFNLEEVESIYRLLLATKTMGRPYALGPKVPAERVKAMRKAFNDTANDPKFIADASKQGRDLSLVTGDEIQDIVEKMASSSKETLAKLEQVSKWTGPAKVAKVELIKFSGKLSKTERGGRKLTIDMNGKSKSTKVSGSRTKVFVNGKKAKRKDVKVGMTCTLAFATAKAKEASEVYCK
jgi:tripartite-type tricarboxylate transporter receptor subunit TctC